MLLTLIIIIKNAETVCDHTMVLVTGTLLVLWWCLKYSYAYEMIDVNMFSAEIILGI